MNRHPALTELSHDHHAALFAALNLRRADEQTVEKARAIFLAYWDTHGNEHFRQEEEVLFPRYSAYGSAHHPMVAQALCDHVVLRRLAHEVATAPADVARLVELGTELERHIRFEERTLFPMIEDTVPNTAMGLIGEALASSTVEQR